MTTDKHNDHVPDLERSDQHIRLRLWLRLFGNASFVERELRERLRKAFGVSLAKFDYLSQLDRQPEGALTMSQLGQFLMVSSGNITGLTDRLVVDGLVERSADPNDRRVQQIRLTDKGRALFSKMAARHESWIDDMFAGLSQDDVTRLLDGLSDMKTALTGTAEQQAAE